MAKSTYQCRETWTLFLGHICTAVGKDGIEYVWRAYKGTDQIGKIEYQTLTFFSSYKKYSIV